MKPNIFMSYSRREVGFVDQLTGRLEEEGFQVWLDYRSLIPGSPWKTQIEKGLDESEVILLVVSKESMASKYVELEWRRVIQEDKRIILVILEAVDLPEVLEKYEWVDFRGNFKAGIKELVGQLESPVQEEHPVPQTGFKVPGVVWWAFLLSLVTAFMSLFSLWSLFVPFFLLPLPYRIFKRDFNITQVQAALWMLPVVLLLTAFASEGSTGDASGEVTGASATALGIFLFSVLVVPVLIFVLRSKGMQRWGKPQASLIKFASLYRPEGQAPKAVSFFIDNAPQDRRIAAEMARTFEKHDHPRAADIQSAEAVFVLLSEFKNDTDADPESQSVFPVMIQTCEPAERLSKVQWIDFRRGVRNLDAMARLLPEPARLLKALGVRPMGNQLTLPPIIMGMYYFLTLLGIFILGSVFKNAWEFPDNFFAAFIPTAIVLVLMALLLYFTNRGLIRRKGRLAGFVSFSFALLGFGVLSTVQTFLPSFMRSEDADFSLAEAYPLFAFVVGMTVMLIFLGFRYRDVHRWFPASTKKG